MDRKEIIREKELHDSIGAMLFSMKLKLDSMNEQFAGLSKANEIRFRNIAENLNKVNSELKAILYSISDPVDADYSLIDALNNLISVLSVNCEIYFNYQIFRDSEDFSLQEKKNIYKIIRTLLNEVIVIKNASMIEVQMVIREDETSIMLETRGANCLQKGIEGLKRMIRSLNCILIIEKTSIDGCFYNVELPK